MSVQTIHLTEMPESIKDLVKQEDNQFVEKASEELVTKVQEILGHRGRMMCGSKSGYSNAHKKNMAIFNANVCTEKHGKIWYGDLDITLDEPKLVQLAEALGAPVYVLYESDARFGTENAIDFSRAVYSTAGHLSAYYKRCKKTKTVVVNNNPKI